VTRQPVEPTARPATLGELRASGWTSRTVKQELRANLLARLAEGRPIVTGIVGYDETVLPALENAIVAGQDLVLLGERGRGTAAMPRSWRPRTSRSRT
jgi:magnesium chelatase subunit I